MKKKKKFDFKHYWLCGECAEGFGGTFPANHVCTVTYGPCPYCKDNENKTIIPWPDFDWPNKDTKGLRD